jgi:hypothetical protein
VYVRLRRKKEFTQCRILKNTIDLNNLMKISDSKYKTTKNNENRFKFRMNANSLSLHERLCSRHKDFFSAITTQAIRNREPI